MELKLSEQTQRKTSTTKTTFTREEMEKVLPEEALEWDVKTMDAAL